MTPHIHQRLFAVTLIATFTVLLLGCDSTKARKTVVERQADIYYRAYLDGDVTQARQSLNLLIEQYHNPQAEIVGPSSRAHALFCAYGRLYLLEKRVGNKDDAEVALTRARYWHLQSYELSEDGWRVRVRLHDFLSQTPEWFEETMNKLDKENNAGKPPKYFQDMTKKQPAQVLEPTPVCVASSVALCGTVDIRFPAWLSLER